MSYIKLDGHYTIDRPGNFFVGAVRLTIKLGNGTTVEMPVPFLPLGDGLAISPCTVLEGADSLRFDFGNWMPLTYRDGQVARIPFAVAGQDVAVRACRAFDADPSTGWHDNYEQIAAWLSAWAQTAA
jgi:hypothetical protein